MRLFLVYYPTNKDGCPDELFGIYEAEYMAQQAIQESSFSESDKRLFFVETAFLNSRI